jgi:hypothetical protein
MVAAEQLPGRLTDQYAGETTITAVRADVREDSSERPALFVSLVLSDPPKGADTWPVDDLWALRRIVRDVMVEIEAEGELRGLPWFVVFESKDHEKLDADDIDELLESDG